MNLRSVIGLAVSGTLQVALNRVVVHADVAVVDDADKRLEKFSDKLHLVHESNVEILPEASEEQTD